MTENSHGQVSEKASNTLEAYHDDPDARQRENLAKLKEAAQEAHKEHGQESVDELEQVAEDKAKSASEVSVEDTASDKHHVTVGDQKEVKKQSYDKTMKQVRSKLPATERGFSKLIHQPLVSSLSDVGGKTALRPSGILGGSLCAFLGSVGLLYASKHYGFTYNYLMLFLLFIGGFLVGLLIEAVGRLLFRKHPS